MAGLLTSTTIMTARLEIVIAKSGGQDFPGAGLSQIGGLAITKSGVSLSVEK